MAGGGSDEFSDEFHLKLAEFCHWRQLPQVSFLSRQNTSFVATKVCLPRQNFCRHKIIFVATKYFCHDKTFVATSTCIRLSRQQTCFVATNTCLSRQKNARICRDKIMFVAANICHKKTRVCRDMHTFVATKDVICCDEHVFVATKIILSRQKFCRGKHTFVARKKKQKNLWQLPPVTEFGSCHFALRSQVGNFLFYSEF